MAVGKNEDIYQSSHNTVQQELGKRRINTTRNIELVHITYGSAKKCDIKKIDTVPTLPVIKQQSRCPHSGSCSFAPFPTFPEIKHTVSFPTSVNRNVQTGNLPSRGDAGGLVANLRFATSHNDLDLLPCII